MVDVIGYEGLYAVTSCGKIWSYRHNRFLKPLDNGRGYLRVNLYKNGSYSPFLIHRLVANAYIPNIEVKPEINHKDENKTHNWINNLEWVTRSENVNYGTRNDRDSQTQSKHLVYCPELGVTFNSSTMASKKTGIRRDSIRKCITGKLKSAGKHPVTGEKLTWVSLII